MTKNTMKRHNELGNSLGNSWHNITIRGTVTVPQQSRYQKIVNKKVPEWGLFLHPSNLLNIKLFIFRNFSFFANFFRSRSLYNMTTIRKGGNEDEKVNDYFNVASSTDAYCHDSGQLRCSLKYSIALIVVSIDGVECSERLVNSQA